MSNGIALWLAAAVFGVALIVQWVVLRARYRNEIFKQRARHLQQQQTTSQHLEQAKRQIGQMQLDLATAKLQIQRHTAGKPAPSPSRSRAAGALGKSLDEASTTRRSLPADGFADTLPSLQFPHDASLLIR